MAFTEIAVLRIYFISDGGTDWTQAGKNPLNCTFTDVKANINPTLDLTQL